MRAIIVIMLHWDAQFLCILGCNKTPERVTGDVKTPAVKGKRISKGKLRYNSVQLNVYYDCLCGKNELSIRSALIYAIHLSNFVVFDRFGRVVRRQNIAH
jgi:hypothetical protein